MRRSIFVSVSLLAACGTEQPPPDEPVDCAKVTGMDTFVVGLERMGTGHVFDFRLMSASPAPPAKGDNTWIVEITAGGAPLADATLQAEPFMAAHGTYKQVVITPGEQPGQYQLAPINMWMPGPWETRIEATSGSTTDTVSFHFCIPE
jgi:hypothetical protein